MRRTKNPEGEWTFPIILTGLAVGTVVFLHASHANASLEPMSNPTLSPDGRETGTSILARTRAMTQSAREREFVRLALAGNSPRGMWEPVEIAPTLHAMPDFLKLGSDEDYLWIPLTPTAAMEILSTHHMRLPTRNEADQIYNYANTHGGKVNFQSWSPYSGHTRWGNTALSETRDRTVAAVHGRTGVLDGHKKYVLGRTNGKVIIYGAHDSQGNSIQPYSTVHDESYLDYSHGIRGVLIS